MKKFEYSHIEESPYRKNLIMFIETLEEVIFDYSFESYKLPALNSHFLCLDILRTKHNIDSKLITEGNFLPLSEEFEHMIQNDIVLKVYIPHIDFLLKRRDKVGIIVDYQQSELKAKISKYSEAAEYICDISDSSTSYLTTIFDLLLENIFVEQSEYDNWSKIYSLTRSLATELVDNGYSPEYVSQELKKSFGNSEHSIECNQNALIKFFQKFTFESKSYQVIFGINNGTAEILKQIENVTVKSPTNSIKQQLKLKHSRDRTVEVIVENVDAHQAATAAYQYIDTIIGLHRISQHHKPIYIKTIAQINEINDEFEILSSQTIKIEKNILLRANNENQIQSYFFDRQLLSRIHPPENFFRAVSLHNNALDSKEPTNQLLDLWTAIETLIGFKSGDEDKINVVCDILTSILNRTYLYSHMAQLYKDIATIIGESFNTVLDKISDDEQPIWTLAKILAVREYQDSYSNLYNLLNEYPLLQYRIEHFSKKLFKDSKSVYEELSRHKLKLKWQLMRIYRNRNMIVHNGEHMPYLNVILGNLHYYIDAMFDVLIEYYHLGFEHNHNIFYHLQKEEMRYLDALGLDAKGKKVTVCEITKSNYAEIIFNNYHGNAIKNLVQEAISNIKKKNESPSVE